MELEETHNNKVVVLPKMYMLSKFENIRTTGLGDMDFYMLLPRISDRFSTSHSMLFYPSWCHVKNKGPLQGCRSFLRLSKVCSFSVIPCVDYKIQKNEAAVLQLPCDLFDIWIGWWFGRGCRSTLLIDMLVDMSCYLMLLCQAGGSASDRV